MRATLLCLLLISACRTSQLGSCTDDNGCPTGSSCDPGRHVCQATAGDCFPVCSLGQSCQNGTCTGQAAATCPVACGADERCISGVCVSGAGDEPRIAPISIFTAAGYTDPSGRAIFDSGTVPLDVRATIRAGAPLDAGSACLRLIGESGACQHPGTLLSTASGATIFSFALPRPAASSDGASLDYVISAASVSGHASVSAVQHAYFDNLPPSVSVIDDPTPYARTRPDGGVAPVVVMARIADGTGVASADLLAGSKVVPASASDGGVYFFQLDPSGAPLGVEGSYAFHIRAVDHLGHDGGADATRFIDDAAPSISAHIFPLDGGPGSGLVQYPGAVASTGWDGGSFIYSDFVHVQGSVSDDAGVGGASVRFDGIDFDGGVSAGTAIDLGCGSGATSCSFDVRLSLNDARNGRFHTGAAGSSTPSFPNGVLTAVIQARDRAVAGDGSPAAHGATDAGQVHVTRLLWQLTPTAAAFSGLAIHPDGELIATDDAGVVHALLADPVQGAPAEDWSFSSSAIGAITGAPAIGAGDGGTAPIYLAGADGGIGALDPTGGWIPGAAAGTAARLSVSPALFTLPDGGDEVIVPDNIAGATRQVWRAAGNTAAGVASLARDRGSAPMIFSGAVWFGTESSGVDWHSLSTDGTVGTQVTALSSTVTAWSAPITDGTNVFIGTTNATSPELVALTPQRTTKFTTTLAQVLGADPTVGSDGKIFAADTGGTLFEVDPADGGVTTVAPLGAGTGGSPLHGWNGKTAPGHVYVTRTGGLLFAFEGSQVSWGFRGPGTPFRATMMDCQGRLFMAGGSTIYAFVTDDLGLADTAWPSMRRDSRNTGNSGAPPWGILRGLDGKCTQ